MCVPAEHGEPAAARPADFGSITLRKITLRLIPFLFLLYIVAWLDRVNVGFAALQMNSDLQFSSAAFGFGSGVFSSATACLRCRAISFYTASVRGVGSPAS